MLVNFGKVNLPHENVFRELCSSVITVIIMFSYNITCMTFVFSFFNLTMSYTR